MPSSPYAQLRVKVNGGAPQTGDVISAAGDTIQCDATSYDGWAAPVARWEIYSFPTGWGGPGGAWSSESVPQTDGTTYTVWYWLGNSEPPSFVAPASTLWGKFLTRLLVNGGSKRGNPSTDVEDKATMLNMPSPSGLKDLAWREGLQSGGAKKWVKDHQANLRVLDALVIGGGGTVTNVSGTAPINVVNGTSMPVVSITAATTIAAGSMSAVDKTLIDGATNAATASTLVKRDASGNTALNTLFTGTVDTPGTDLVLAADSTITITLDITTTNEVLVSNPIQAPSFKLASQVNLTRSIPLNWSSCKVGGIDSWDISDVSDCVCTVQDAFANLSLECRFVHGSSLTAVSIWNTGPGTGANPLPANAPSFTLYRKLLSTGIASVVGTINATLDGTYRGTRRKTTIDLSAGTGHGVDAILYRYYLVITPEFGANSLPGHKVSGVETDYYLPSGFAIGQD